MNLESQVCSLELAKRLKELGVKQESFFYWVKFNNTSSEYKIVTVEGVNFNKSFLISAYTVAELGEMLPGLIKIKDDYLYLAIDCDKHPYYEPMNKKTELYSKYSDDDDNEANARAKMLIYLLENGLIKND